MRIIQTVRLTKPVKGQQILSTLEKFSMSGIFVYNNRMDVRPVSKVVELVDETMFYQLGCEFITQSGLGAIITTDTTYKRTFISLDQQYTTIAVVGYFWKKETDQLNDAYGIAIPPLKALRNQIQMKLNSSIIY